MAAIVDKNKCNGCGSCKDMCPVNAITIESSKAVVSAECVGCGACVGQCPQSALSLAE